MPGATPEFKQQLQTAFDTIQVGQTFTFRRTFTEGDVALFCGVTIPSVQMPAFWRSWLFQLDPFTRLIGGMVVTALHGLPVVCRPNELQSFTAPPGQNCGDYMEPFFARGGNGYIVSNESSSCQYCAYTSGDQFFLPLGFSFDSELFSPL